MVSLPANSIVVILRMNRNKVLQHDLKKKKGNNVSCDYESCFLYVWGLGHIQDSVAPGENS